MTLKLNAPVESCFICGKRLVIGQGVYDGRYITLYKFTVCNPCYESNWDGWAPYYEQSLIAHIKEKSLPFPKRNEKGWFPRD